MGMYRCGFLLITLLIPFPSVQHFVWPLHWCLLADLCNHTWIPECGEENETLSTRRLFIDECDMYEYNCDFERDYDMVNYSDCFMAATGCPPRLPCPSHAPCKKNNRRMFPTYSRTRTPTTIPDLPPHMLRGKRRYKPRMWRKRKTTKKTVSRQLRKTVLKTRGTTLQTVIIKKETIVKNGRTFVKVVKAMVKSKRNILKDFDAADFLEN